MRLTDALNALALAGGDTASIEVKRAAGGYPESVIESLGALANLPGGGTLVFGLDEAANFAAVGVYDAQRLKQRLGNDAREFMPPIALTISDEMLMGKQIVIADVAECDASAKPCQHRSGRAWTRSYDGDFLLSELERAAFVSNRRAPTFDRSVVPGATEADLDSASLDSWRGLARASSPQGLGRFDDTEILVRAGALTAAGEVTLAGLLTFGKYPQEHFPRLVVQAARVDSDGHQRNIVAIDGSIPAMLDRTMDWLNANVSTVASPGEDGRIRDVPAFPLLALRELVANALVHRDLADWSAGIAVDLRLHEDKFMITNPGGLHGVTIDRLGRERVSHSRNAALVRLCQNARAGDSRVIEALASGLVRVRDELDARALPEPQFFDSSIRFTALLRNPYFAPRTGPQPSTSASGTPKAGSRMEAVFQALIQLAPASVADVARRTGLPDSAVRKAIGDLRDKGLVEIESGGQGKRTIYRTVR